MNIMSKLNKLAERVPADLYEAKIRVISHNDLDGYGPNLILSKVINNKEDIENISINDVNLKILDVLNIIDDIDLLFIVDLSCSKEVADEIEKRGKSKVILLDHHATALWLNDYDFALVSVSNPNRTVAENLYPSGVIGKACGTSLLYDLLALAKSLKPNPNTRYYFPLRRYSSIVHLIRLWDTFDWKYVFDGYEDPKKLNKIFHMFPTDEFIYRYGTNYVDSDDYIDLRYFNAVQLFMLDCEEKRVAEYCRGKEKYVLLDEMAMQGRIYKTAYLMADNNLSELFEMMMNKFPDVEVYIIFTGTGLSFRTDKEGVNVADIAKHCEGGGHIQAAGCKYDDPIIYSNIKDFLY